MSMIALSPLLKLQVLISLVLSLGLILNSLLISSNLLLHILICLRRIGSSIMYLFKRFAKKMKLFMMIATCMIQFLKMKFYISMLIFVEWIDLVKGLSLKKRIFVSIISMKEQSLGLET